MSYTDFTKVEYPAEINHFFKLYSKEVDEIVEWIRMEDEKWLEVANTQLCNIANEFNDRVMLDNEKMKIIAKRIKEKANERF